MVSRKNIKYKMQQDAKRVPHYGIRKLSIGVASVLLGTVFYMQNGTAHADVNPTLSTGNDSVNVVNKDFDTSGSAGASSTSTGVGSADSASSVVFAGDTTNSMATSQTSGSPVEGETNQSNNAFLAASEPESTSSGGQVNVGTDNSNSISSLPPASHHQPSVTVGNQSNERLFDNLSLSVNQKLNVNNSSLLASKAALTGISNQRFAGLQQSLVQQDTNNTDWTRNGYYQARASNVDFSLTDTSGRSGNGVGAEIPTEISLGFSDNYHFGIKAHFTLQTADLKLNNRVYIGSIMLSNSLNDAAHNIAIIESSDPHNMGEFSYQGQYIGHIYEYQLDGSNADFFLKVEQANSFATPVIDIANWSNKDIWGYNWASSPKYFVNVPNQFTENLMMPGGKTYHFNMHYDYYELSNLELHNLSTIGTHDFNFYDYTYPIFAKNGATPGYQLNSNNIAILNEKNGQGLVLPNTGYEMAYSYRPSVNTVHPTSFQIIWCAFVKDKDNKLTNDGVLVYGPWIQYANVGNGYSLNDLKNMCGGNAGIYSLQNDGTYLCYIKLLPSALVMDRESLINSLRSKSKIIAMQGDQALQNTLNLYYSQPFGGRSLELLIPSYTASPSRYDSLSVDNVQLIDPITSNVLSHYDWHNIPDTLQFSDKAAIRVHYINGYNGQQIGNSQIFNDDQGKTLSYQAQNSLGAGYSLRRSGSHALLNGQSLPSSYTLLDGSQKSSITYPRENTVSDVYYVIDPDTETVKVNVVDTDTSSILSSYTLSGLYGSTIQPTSAFSADLQTLLSSGKYDLVSNPLTSLLKYSTMNNPITVSLKHHIDSTQRHYRVIEDLPDGTKKVIIDVEATLYKDANTDKWQPDFAYLDGDFTKKVLMSDIYKLNVGQQADDGLPDFLKADIDKVSGYSWNLVDGTVGYQDGLFVGFYNSDEKNAGEIYMDLFNGPAKNVASILPSRDFHITYSRRSYPVMVNYYDIDGKLVDSVTSMHKFGDTVSISPVAPANYVLASGQAKVDYLTGLGLNEVDFLVEPKLRTTTETKTVFRTIKVQTPDGQTNNVVQTVTFVRNSYLNQVTKQTTYSPWSFGGQYQFSGYLPKPMAGYTVDVIPAVIVTPDSLNTTVNVVYHKIPVVYSVDYQLANGTVVKNVSMTPERDGTIHLTAPQGYHLLTTATDVQVGSSSQKLTVLVLPDEQTYTAYSALPSSITEPLIKTVTRTVKITLPNGHVRTVKQSVKFERTATVAANGKITYSNWTGVGQTSFDRLFVPKRRGYRLVMTNNQDQTLIGVNQMMVDPMMDNVVINVKYVK